MKLITTVSGTDPQEAYVLIFRMIPGQEVYPIVNSVFFTIPQLDFPEEIHSGELNRGLDTLQSWKKAL